MCQNTMRTNVGPPFQPSHVGHAADLFIEAEAWRCHTIHAGLLFAGDKQLNHYANVDVAYLTPT